MRRILIVLLLLTAALLLVGCNPGVSSDAAARTFINALFSGNEQAARDVVCERAKPMITDGSLDETAATPVDTSGLSYTVRDATDTTANVVVSGTLRIGPSGSQQEIDFSSFSELATLPAVVENQAWKICPASIGLDAG